jgi:hypothetical protein
MDTTKNFKIAVLIDGDNAEATLIDQVLNEVSKFGRVTIKRIYADWTTPHMKGWKEQLNKFAIRPIQKFSYTTSKNSTDSALIIDAMDIMHSKLAEGFCIVSSDSDYTGLAHRLKEEGLFVMGIGRAHTPEAFVKACENFTYAELLVRQVPETKDTAPERPKLPARQSRQPRKRVEPEPVQEPVKVTKRQIDLVLVEKAFDMAADNLTGQAFASQLGTALKKVDPTFDIRTYGYKTFRNFLEDLPGYEVVVHPETAAILIKKD